MENEIIIPIISDSHGYGKRAEAVLDKLSKIGCEAKELVFLGDGTRELIRRLPEDIKVYAVKGNCDGFGGASDIDILDGSGEIVPTERVEFFGGKKALLIHGHEYFVKGGLSLAVARAVKVGADILLFGHTHQPLCTRIPAGEAFDGVTLEKELHVFNPGSLMEGSFGLLTVRNREILLSHGRI